MTLFVILTLSAILLVVIGLLLVPLELYINTSGSQYYLQAKGLLRANIEYDTTEIIRIRLKTILGNFFFYPLRKKKEGKKAKSKSVAHRSAGRKVPFRRIFSVLRSFKIKQFRLDIDTGNCLVNARLYPLFSLLNFYGGEFNTNFIGKNQLIILLRNRPILMLKSFINP